MPAPTRTNPLPIIKRTFFGAVAVLMLIAFPAPAFLASVNATSPDDTTNCQPVQPATSGTTTPTGAAAKTFTFNKCTGLWTNTYYTFSPATRQYTPNDGYGPIYKCDESTWTWQNTNDWVYNSSAGKYEQQNVNATPPAGTVSGTCEKPVSTTSLVQPSDSNVSANQPASNGLSTVNGDNSNDTTVNGSTNTSLTNNINSSATSGDVNLNRNTDAGSATSGNASASATVINSVNSSSGMDLAGAMTFTKDINGNVNGDITIDPSQLQPASTNLKNSNNLTLNSQNTGTINNNLNLSAQSGDVNTNRNTKVGDATSGSATAMADVVNMLNTYVNAGQSFVGTININGNLNGNILMPPKFITDLQASGAPKTTINLNNVDTNNITDNSVTNIMNQINSNAVSGAVSSSQNTSAGSATSGSATTNVDVYNLTGRKIIGNNGILVFVNVMGKWVGVITGAPSGSNSAMLGGTTSVYNSDTNNVNIDNNNSINNNINVAAKSGDVNSNQNTEAGNATSGDAKTGVSLANYSNDYLDYTGWFGILFINVFGSWNGNFGFAQSPASQGSSSQPGNKSKSAAAPVFKFTPKKNGGVGTSSASYPASYNGPSNNPSGVNSTRTFELASAKLGSNGKVLATNIATKPMLKDAQEKTNGNSFNWYIIAGTLILASIIMYFLPSHRSLGRD